MPFTVLLVAIGPINLAALAAMIVVCASAIRRFRGSRDEWRD